MFYEAFHPSFSVKIKRQMIIALLGEWLAILKTHTNHPIVTQSISDLCWTGLFFSQFKAGLRAWEVGLEQLSLLGWVCGRCLSWGHEQPALTRQPRWSVSDYQYRKSFSDSLGFRFFLIQRIKKWLIHLESILNVPPQTYCHSDLINPVITSL